MDAIKCYATRNNPFYIFPQWERVHLVVYNLCPFSIMCLCNTYIIYITVRSARVRLPTSGHFTRHRQLSMMLMLVTFAFVFLTLPSCIYFVFFRHRMSTRNYSRTYRYLVQISLGSVQFTSHAVNFFLYCFSTRNFRNELRDCLHEICFCYQRRRKEWTRTTTCTVHTRRIVLEEARSHVHRTHCHSNRKSTLEHQQIGEAHALKDI
jgi:hypothetical protein